MYHSFIQMHKSYLQTAAILGALSVLLGAFAAHGLKKMVDAQSLVSFETAVRYQFYHVFALLSVAVLYRDFKNNSIVWAGRLFIIGIVLFSGSLYLLTFFPQYKFLGPVTPLGGTAFIAGWILMFAGVSKRQ